MEFDSALEELVVSLLTPIILIMCWGIFMIIKKAIRKEY